MISQFRTPAGLFVAVILSVVITHATQASPAVAVDIAATLVAQEASNDIARAALAADEKNLTAADVTVALLEQARLDVETAEAAVAAADAAIADSEKKQDDSKQQQESLATGLRKLEAAEGASSSKVTELTKALAENRQAAESSAALLKQQTELKAARRSRLSIAVQRLDLLRSRFDIANLNITPDTPEPERLALQASIERNSKRALNLRAQLILVTDDSAAGKSRRQMVELQAQDAEERAELSQVKLELADEQAAILTLQRLSDATELPVVALNHAQKKAESLREGVRARRERLIARASRLERQIGIATERAEFTDAAPRLLARQGQLIGGLLAETRSVLAQSDDVVRAADSVAKHYQLELQRGLRRDLGKRRAWPSDVAGWQAMFVGLGDLALRVVSSVGTEFTVIAIALREAGLAFWVKLLAGVVLIALGLLALRRLLVRRLMRHIQESGSSLSTAAVAENLLATIVPLVLLYVAWLLGLQLRELALLITLSVVFPVISLSTSLSRLLILDLLPAEAEGPEHKNVSRHRQLFFNRLRWVLWLSGGVAATTVVARTVPLSPAVAHAVDVVSMVCLLAVCIPMLRIRALVRDAYGNRRAQWSASVRLLMSVGLIIPVVLLLCAVAGLAGYVDLAWLVARHTGWLALVGGLVWVIRGFLNDGAVALKRYVLEKQHPALINENLIDPVRKIASLGLLVAAGWLLLRLFDPALSQTLIAFAKRILGVSLFTLGDTSVSIQSIVFTLLVFVFVIASGRWLKQVSYHWPFGAIDDAGIRHSLSTFVQYAVVLIGFVVALRVIGVDLTALTIFAGALGVGIGFGLQNIANNFISGILLLMERPLKSGDIVTVGAHEGAVTSLGIRSLTLRTWDRHEVIVPNASIISEPFTNWTHGDDVVRSVASVNISYSDDPHEALKLIEQLMADSELILKTPKPRAMVWEFGTSAVDLRVEFFCRLGGELNRFQIRSQLLLDIWDAFREQGITIPFPQSEVTIKRNHD